MSSFIARLPRSSHRVATSLSRSYATQVTEASGVKVAGFESGAPPGTVNLTVVVKAGARYETKAGVAHALKNFAFKSTSSGSALKIARETELYGGLLSSALSREHLFLTAEFLRGDEQHFLHLLASVLSETQYYPHEYSELVLPTVQSEAMQALATPSVNSLDIAHQLAFRRGLGNSLFASPHTPISVQDVKSYAQQAYSKSNIAVLGGGISTEALSAAVSSAFGPGSGSSTLSSDASKYFGGERRLEIDTHAGEARPSLTIAFGAAGSSAGSADLKVLPHLVGGASSVKWCAGTSPLSKIAEKVAGAEVKATLLPYSDASLFAVTVTAPTAEGVKSLARDVVSTMKEAGNAKDEDVKKAIAKSKVAEATKFENTAGLMSIVAPGLFQGSIPSAESSFSSLDQVSASSLSKAASELFKGKPTVVAVGDLGVLPYADEIGL